MRWEGLIALQGWSSNFRLRSSVLRLAKGAIRSILGVGQLVWGGHFGYKEKPEHDFDSSAPAVFTNTRLCCQWVVEYDGVSTNQGSLSAPIPLWPGFAKITPRDGVHLQSPFLLQAL